MGCSQSKNNGTLDTEPTPEAPIQRNQAAGATSGRQPLLPNNPNFHASVNGRDGHEFKTLYTQSKEALDGGNFGQIYQCQHKQASPGSYWKVGAVKITQPNALDTLGGPINSYDEMELRCQEIRTLMLLQQEPASPRILRLQEYFYNPKTKELKVVTELLQMNLRDWIDHQRQFTEAQGRAVAHMLVEAMGFMHERNIVHRDIKEANVVFQKTGDLSSLKLVDFGLAKDLMPGQKERAFCGSMGYIAPEIYMREPYSFKVDLFSFGVLMFKILSGKRPWPAGPQEVTGRKTVNLEYRIVNEHWKGVSQLGRAFIRKLLVFEEERMDAKQASRHGWLHEDTRTILRTDMMDQSNHTTPSDAVINPEGASRTQENRENPKFWVEDNILDALQKFIRLGAFRGQIAPQSTTRREGFHLLEEQLPQGAQLLPYYIISLPVYTERECRHVCREIVKRIQLFHKESLVHRKLHMENIVVEAGMTTFNASLRGVQYAQKIQQNEPLTGRVGRQLKGWQAFVGPEIQSEFYHDKRVDLWSLGAIIYMCLCGMAPDKPENYFLISQPSDMARDLVLRLLQKHPRDRLSIDAVLRHEWMTAPDEVLQEHDLFLAKTMFDEDYRRCGMR